MQEVSYAHIVGALKAYLIMASYVPTKTKAKQSHAADVPIRWFIESITLSMVLIAHILTPDCPDILGAVG